MVCYKGGGFQRGDGLQLGRLVSLMVIDYGERGGSYSEGDGLL